MATMTVNFNKPVGPIKKVNGVGQPPIWGAAYDDLFHFLTEANIPYSRLHDVGGTFGGGRFVDIPNVFPNFDADENDPASYFFPYTDWLLEALDKAGVEPVYRLGVTIENIVDRYASPRIFPPKDYEKWARICEHIIRHYTEGWANGYHFKINFWEIWNEPDNSFDLKENAMWQGSREDYYRLYEVTARHLKKCFPHLKIGGFASCGFYAITEEKPSPRQQYFVDFFTGFLEWISSDEHKAPLDFFSWHSYADVETTAKMADYVEESLEAFGYAGLETQLNEWNNAHDSKTRGTSFASANATAMMLKFQHQKTDILCFYDARIGQSVYGGLFNPITYEPFCTYYGFKAFGELYALGNEAECSVEGDGLYAVAATDGEKKALLIANIADHAQKIEGNLPAGMKLYLIDENHFMTQEGDASSLTLGPNQVAFIAQPSEER